MVYNKLIDDVSFKLSFLKWQNWYLKIDNEPELGIFKKLKSGYFIWSINY